MAKELSKKPFEPIADENEVGRISGGVTIKGDISASTDLRIDGQVNGTIYSRGRIVVGESAELTGTVLCNETDFRGKLEGDLYVRDTMTLREASSINGSFASHKLQVNLGASIDGNCKMISEPEFDAKVAEKVKLQLPVKE